MAAATRLTEPLRTSPTAKMPGLLVSRNSGGSFSCSSRAAGMSFPVRRNPCLSVANWPASQSVPGFAPMKMNSPDTASSSASGLPSRRSRTASSWFVPVRAVTWVDGQTTMRGWRSILSTR